MIEIALAVIFGAVVYVIVRAGLELLETERARVNELLGLLEAKAAPAEYAAVRYAAEPPDEDRTYLSSDDGLIVVEVD